MASDAPIAMAEVFARVARVLLAADDLDATLRAITTAAVETIDGCDFASVSNITEKHITTRASTDDIAGIVDAIQYQTGEGPCLDAIREHAVFRTGDLGSETRWPEFSRRARHVAGCRAAEQSQIARRRRRCDPDGSLARA